MPEPDQQLDRDDLDLDYRQEYLKWVSSLSSTDRRQLIALGLDKPSVERASFVHARGETFRDSPGMIETWLDDHGEGWHPGLPVEEDEPDDLDEEEVDNLARFDPEIIGSIMRIIFVPDLDRGINPRSVTVKVFALAHALHIEGVGDKPLDYWAEKIGCTKALLSFYIVRLRDRANLDCRAGKSVIARDKLATAALWNTSRRDGTQAKRKRALPGADTEKITDGAA